MKTAIQVLANPTYDNGGPSIMIQTRLGTKYIIGQFSEGLQRCLSQNRIRMSKLQHIFLTGSVSWDSVGGLPGFLLTFGGENQGKITVQSASTDLEPIKQSWRHFIFHNGLDVDLRSPKCGFQDDLLSVEGVSFKAEGDNTSLKPSSSYIVQVLPSRGKFLPKKAIELGVPKGAMFRDLTEGKSVVSPNGIMIHPDQVMEPAKTPPRVLVIDCPSSEYITDIINFPWDKPLTRKRKHEECEDENSSINSNVDGYDVDVKVVYHFLGESVNPFEGQYYDFIMKFSEANVLQYICHPLYSPNGITLESLALLNNKLRQIFPSNFKALYSENSKLQFPNGLSEAIKPLRALDITTLEPEIKHETIKEDNVITINDISSNSNLSQIDEPQVITLGTGSSQPSKYRNVSCTVVRVPFGSSCKSIMFDCGEGTLGSIKRVFGPNGTNELLNELDVIYISHLHADHHLGGLSVIAEWLKVNDSSRQLVLLGPGPFKSFINEWGEIDPDLKSALHQRRLQFIDNEKFIYGKGYFNAIVENSDSEQNISNLAGLNIQTCRAIHCDLSYCVSVKFTDTDFKVSYSGDTRPNMFFARTIGSNSDLLIHEATHESELAEEAKSKRHSTIGEAISVSKAMKAKATVLTHFSQRYAKLPELGDMDKNSSALALAFDGMQIVMGEIPNQLKKMEELQLILAETKEREEEELKIE